MTGRGRSALIKLGVFAVAWFALQLLLGIPLLSLFAGLGLAPFATTAEGGGLAGGGFAPGTLGLMLYSSTGLIAVAGAVTITHHLAGGPKLPALGLRPRQGWLLQLLVGLAIGPQAFLAILLLELAAGWAMVSVSILTVGEFAIALLTFAFVAVAEELLFRGFVLQVLQRSYGTVVAVVGSSVLFGLLHGLNPGAGVAALTGVALAGLVFAYAYLATRQLWLPIGLHLSWNLSQGTIYGFPVSGLEGDSLLETEVSGPQIITGGPFGPEAGLVVLLGVALATAAIYLTNRHQSGRADQ